MRTMTARRDAALQALIQHGTYLTDAKEAAVVLRAVVDALLDPEPSGRRAIHVAREFCQEALGVHELDEMVAVTDVLWYLRDPDSITPNDGWNDTYGTDRRE